MSATIAPTASLGRLTAAQRWSGALLDCSNGLGRDGLSPSTVARVCKHLRKFATETGVTPYDVTPADVAGWLDSLTCSTTAAYAYRTSLRTFYRWATRSGRCLSDPTAHTGPHPCARPVPDPWGSALAAFARWHRAAGHSSGTVTTEWSHLSRLARQTGAPDPWSLTAEDLADWLARQRWSRETTRAARTAVRTFYRWAWEVGHIDTNPAAALPVVRTSDPVPRPATESQYHRALSDADPRTALMLRLAGELGLRRAEIAHVHSRDIDTDDAGNWWLTVHGKGGKLRRLPLPHALAAALRALPSGWAFPGNQSGHLSPARVGELAVSALPDGITLHQLRHRFASQAYAINRDIYAVQHLLGHSSPSTTQLYVRLPDDNMRALIDAMQRVGACG